MKKFRIEILISIVLLLIQAAALADPIPIDFNPTDQTVEFGDQVSVDVVVTPGLTDIIAEFDMIVNWDAGLMSLADVVFGPALGDSLFFEAFTTAIDLGGGMLNAAELSLLPELLLAGLQGGSPFTLFSLTFDTIGVGTSSLDLTGNIFLQVDPFNFIGDAGGLPLEALAGTGSITIEEAPVTVPEPSTWMLMLIGLAALTLSRRKQI